MGKKGYYIEPPSEKERKAFSHYLTEEEELVVATGLSSFYLRNRFFIGIIWPGIILILLGFFLAYWWKVNLGWGLAGGLTLATVFALLKTIYTHHANRYLLTNRRVIIKKGILTVKLTSALYDKITHIEMDQTFFEKVFMHHGLVIVNTAGLNKGEITLRFIDHPVEFKNLLEKLITKEREKFGMGPISHGLVEGEVVEG